MNRYIVTFPVGGGLADSYAEISAIDELSARLAIIGVYGRDGWAGVYRDGRQAREMIERYGLVEVLFGEGRDVSAPVKP